MLQRGAGVNATVVRLTKPWIWASGGAEVGQVLPHEGTDRFTGWPLVSLPSGRMYPVPPDHCEVIPAHLVDRHVVTEKEAPDLDDLVRLIRYLREHDLDYAFDNVGDRRHPRMVVKAATRKADGSIVVRRFHEGEPLPEAHYVGPDGTVYDVEGMAL